MTFFFTFYNVENELAPPHLVTVMNKNIHLPISPIEKLHVHILPHKLRHYAWITLARINFADKIL